MRTLYFLLFSIPLVTAALAAGCAPIQLASPEGVAAAPTDAETRAQWWSRHKSRAEFVPGKGYRVADVDGFFDEYGNPMDGTVVQASFDKRNAPAEGIIEELSPKRNISKFKEVIGQGESERRAQNVYAEGVELYKQKKYLKAVSKFKQAASLWPDSVIEDNAMFMTGECYFFADRYPDANDAFNALSKKYPRTRNLDKSTARQFAIARYWDQYYQKYEPSAVVPNVLDKTRYLWDTRGHALKTYENIRLADPTGPLADDTLMATANLYFREGRYSDADYEFGLLRREYPNSEHQFRAHLLGLQCKLKNYQGPNYEGTSLVEADKLAETLLTQFSHELKEDRQKVLKIRGEIAAQRANRDWTMAEYFANLKSYGAARFYYEQLAENHPGTKLAGKAQERLAQYQDQPAVAPQKLEWLVNLFPDDTKRR